MSLENYKELLKQPTEPDTVRQLGQPERHVLLSYKIYRTLLARIEKLEQYAREYAEVHLKTAEAISSKG